MSTPITEQEHREIQELLGVYALDAVDKETAARVEAHLDGCVKCSVEVAQHHEVAGLLANSGGQSPAQLWDGIASHLDGSVPPSWERLAGRLDAEDVSDRPPRIVGVGGGAGDLAPGGADAANVVPTNVVPITDARPRNRLAVRIVAAVAAAAAVLALVLGLQVHHLDQKVSALQAQPSLSPSEQSAVASPSTRRIELTSSTGAVPGKVTVVLTASGTGFVEASSLKALPRDKTYQLWGVVGNQTISLGLMGSTPRVVPFSVDANATVTAFAITAEQAGGVATTTNQPVVAGEVSA
jgi:anti-sigma factor RsiW